MTFLLLPYKMANCSHPIGWLHASTAIATFVFGMCISGFFGSWLIQRYRRNRVFVVSTIGLGLATLAFSLFDDKDTIIEYDAEMYVLLGLCFACGVFFGNAKRVLSCTLLIDKTESCHRTNANHVAICIARIAIAVAPIIAIIFRKEFGNLLTYIMGSIFAIISAIIVICVRFPFRAPDDGVKLISIDRFFLPQGWNVALVIMLSTIVIGIVMATHMNIEFCTALTIGFFIASLIMHQKEAAEWRYTSAVGNTIAIVSAIFITIYKNGIGLYIAAFGISFGITFCLSEQLHKLLKHSNHCQRSTAESTYFLASDSGLLLGIAIGWQTTVDAVYVPNAEIATIATLATAAIICSINAMIKEKEKDFNA